MNTRMKIAVAAGICLSIGLLSLGCSSTTGTSLNMQPVGLASPLAVTSLLTTTNGILPVGCSSASFANIGTNIATVNAVALPATTAIGFGPLAPGWYLPQIPYSATGTIFRIDYTH